MYQFLLTDDFLESLEQLDPSVQGLIKTKLRWFASSENPLPLAKKLRGYKDLYRFRVGHYRLIFRLSKKSIILLLVKNRKDVYMGL